VAFKYPTLFTLMSFLFSGCGNGLNPREPSLSEPVRRVRSITSDISLVPLLSAISPSRGHADGGTLVTLTGHNFTDGMRVYLGEVECGSVTLIDTTSLTCITGSSVAGTVNVYLNTSAGFHASLTSAFTYYNSLYVTQFTPTSVGFTVKFNHPINVGTYSDPNIHLYEASYLPHGEVDVTLQGETTGPVKGSLVIDQNRTRFNFIRTGSHVLAADNYTVNLRSTSSGFKDADGLELDGNNDGTGGDSYIQTFSVGNFTSGYTVRIADFARGPGQAVNIPATGNGIPVVFIDNNPANAVLVDSIRFSVVYDPALLNITGITEGADLPVGASSSIDTSVPGVAQITLSAPDGLNLGGGTPVDLVHITATVPNDAIYGKSQVLAVTNATIGNEGEPTYSDSGLHLVAHFGDLARDASYNSLDVQRMSRLVARLDSGLQTYPLIDPMILADIDGDRAFTAADTNLISRVALRLTAEQIPAIVNSSPTMGTDP